MCPASCILHPNACLLRVSHELIGGQLIFCFFRFFPMAALPGLPAPYSCCANASRMPRALEFKTSHHLLLHKPGTQREACNPLYNCVLLSTRAPHKFLVSLLPSPFTTDELLCVRTFKLSTFFCHNCFYEALRAAAVCIRQ